MAITRIITPAVTDDAVTLAKMAPGTDGNIISYDASGNPVAIATGNDGQVLTSAGAGAPPVFETLPAGGITVIDQWRVTTDANFSGGTNNITANWERNDTTGAALLGTGVSESSGVFTFGSTGLYLIQAGLYFVVNNASSQYTLLGIRTCQDGSSFSDRVQVATHIENETNQMSNATGSYIFDVTNTSTHKVRLVLENQAAVTLSGDSAKDRTYIRFTKLAAT